MRPDLFSRFIAVDKDNSSYWCSYWRYSGLSWSLSSPPVWNCRGMRLALCSRQIPFPRGESKQTQSIRLVRCTMASCSSHIIMSCPCYTRAKRPLVKCRETVSKVAVMESSNNINQDWKEESEILKNKRNRVGSNACLRLKQAAERRIEQGRSIK